MAKKITLLGSTGSIGTQSLDVIQAQGYEVYGLAAHSNVSFLFKQIQQFSPAVVAVVDDEAAKKMRTLLDGMTNAPKLLCGKEGLE